MLAKRDGISMKISQQIQVKEAAFRYGEGFFTTTRVKRFTPLWLPEHIKRLNNSLSDFKMPGLDEDLLFQLASNWPIENQLAEGFLRILVWAEGNRAHFYLEGGSLDSPPRNLKLAVSEIKRHSSEPLLKYKSFNYWNNNLAYRQALQNGYDEAILLNEKGEITECSRNNLFWIKDGVIFTPQISCGLLPGIARNIIMTIANEQGIEIKQGQLLLEDLQAAQTVFLSNSVHGIREVMAVNAHSYQPGEIIQLLQKHYEQREFQASMG